MEQEELSFGGDPEREPWLRVWAAAHVRLLAAGTAVLVVLGLAGAGGWYLYERSWLPEPPPEVALSPSLAFEVTMCTRAECPGLDRATTRREAEAALRTLPEVTSVEARNGAELSDQWRRGYEGIGDDSWGRDPDLFGDVLRGTLRRGEDFPAVAEKLKPMPGVSAVWRLPVTFWEDRAEAGIYLCGKDPIFSSTPECQRNRRAGVTGAITEEEKAAIIAQLRDLPGVETIYFEEAGHALELAKLSNPENASDGIFTASFYVKFSDPALARAIAPAIGPMPGVMAVIPLVSEK